MEADTNQYIKEKIEIFKAVILMPNISTYVKELYEARIETLQAVLDTNNSFK